MSHFFAYSYCFTNHTFSDLDSIISSELHENIDEEMFNATELYAADPDFTVNHDNIIVNIQKPLQLW